MNEAGKFFGKHVPIAEAPFFQSGRLEVLDHYIGFAEQFEQLRAAIRLRQVKDDAAFVAVHAQKVRR